MTLRVPRRAVEGGTIRFAGKVRAKGARLGSRGKLLEVQVRVGRRWRTVGRSLRTGRRGNYALPYRFTADYERPYTFKFRAVVLRERGFPFLPSRSRIRRVTVSPS